MEVEIEKRPAGEFTRKRSRGKRTVQVLPAFLFEMGDIDEVIFVEAPGQWTKCEVRLRYNETFKENSRIARGRGISRLHEDDTWDRKTGRMIAFGKAMADLFTLSLPKLFRGE